MDYKQSIDWLYSRLPAYQKIGDKALKFGLENITELCDFFGNPQNNFLSIHVAGTNGKGSTSAFLASALMENGYKVGLTVSPHLLDLRERLILNGEFCKEDFVIEFVEKIKTGLDAQKYSFFEVMICMAFVYFDEMKVDYAVVETGMGGRLDSTNILKPILSVITNVALDHTAFLGDSREKIAFEKAGIIKHNTPAIVGEKDEETFKAYQAVAKEKHAELFFIDDLEKHPFPFDFVSDFLQKNAQLAWHALHSFTSIPLDEKKTELGLENFRTNTKLRGRWEQIQSQPKVVMDVGHNPAAFLETTKLLKKSCENQLHLVLGFVQDKDVAAILDLLPIEANFYFTQPNLPRALKLSDLQNLVAERFQNVNYFSSVELAYKAAIAKAEKSDMVFVGGSNFVVSDFLEGREIVKSTPKIR